MKELKEPSEEAKELANVILRGLGMLDGFSVTTRKVALLIDNRFTKERNIVLRVVAKHCAAADKSTHPSDLADQIRAMRKPE